jgi:hypothetical protein
MIRPAVSLRDGLDNGKSFDPLMTQRGLSTGFDGWVGTCDGANDSQQVPILDSSALPVSISCGDPKFPPNHQAVAIPPSSISFPAQEHFGFHAIHVALVGECVCARC